MPALRLNDSKVPLEERLAYAKTLGGSKDKNNLEPLLRGLEVKSDELRAAVIAGLEALGGAAPLFAKVASAAEPLVTKKLALLGLRALKPADAGQKLGPLLQNRAFPATVRAEIALALAVVGAADAKPPLIACLDDQDRDVRYYAAEALAYAQGADALAAIRARRQKEADPVVQDALMTAERRLSAPA